MLGTKVGVYADDELEGDCIEEWLRRIPEEHKIASQMEVETEVFSKIAIFASLPYEKWGTISAGKRKGSAYIILPERGDMCGGVGRIRFNASRHTHRLLGLFDEYDNRFVIFVADTVDRKGKRTKPCFLKKACTLVRTRELNVINNTGEIHGWEN